MLRSFQASFKAVIVITMIATDAIAQTNMHDASGTFNGLLELIQNTANQWGGRLRNYAIYLFWSLATIQLIWTAGFLAVKNADFSEVMSELFRYVMVIGFFSTLLMFSVEWTEAIVNSFRQAGAHAAGIGTALRPTDVFGLAVEFGDTIGDIDTWNPAVAGMVVVACFITLICFTFIAAYMAVTIIESYIVINASVLFLGFGGSQWTRDYAVAMLRYSLAVSAKLLILTLIVSLIMDSARSWQLAYTHDKASMWTITGLALICAYSTKTIADLVSSLISGVSPGGGGVLGGMAAAGMAFGAGALAAMSTSMGSGGILGSAGKSVSDILKSTGGTSGGGGTGGGSPMASMMSGGGGGTSAPSSPGPRVGGGGPSSPPPPPSPKSGSSAASGGSSAPASPKSSGAIRMAHAAAEMGIKTVGTAASIAVPGAEGAESLSVGPPPEAPNFDETPENIIRPDTSDLHRDRDENINRPEAKDWYDDNNNLTMSGLQEQLKSKGKTS